jgi:hypothetical protein
MEDIAWELSVINLIFIGISTLMPYAMLADHHFSRFIPDTQSYEITIKQPHYCHEN